MQEGSGVPNLQTELNYLNSRVIVILLIWVYAALGGGAGGGCPGWSTIVYMSSGMFRGKESSNRIELSQLVQELLNFGVFGFLWLLGVGVGGWGWGVVGGAPHTCAHACVVNMVISCKWSPPLGKSLGIPYDVICMCVHACTCMCMWVGCTPSPPPPPSTHPPPPGGPPESFKIQ